MEPAFPKPQRRGKSARRGVKRERPPRRRSMNGVALCRQHHDGAHGRFGVRLKREFKEWFAGRRFEDFEAIFAPGERRPWVESLPR